MPFELSAPARINVLGNPSDANEGDFATISAAVDLRAGAYIEPVDKIILQQAKETSSGMTVETEQEFPVGTWPLPYDGELDLIKGAINRLVQYSPELKEKYAARGFLIRTWTEVPRQSGLAGSSLFVVLTLAGLRAVYELDPAAYNNYFLAEMTQRVEAKELSITCGFADRYVPFFGGIAYLDYREKLHHTEIGFEPYVTYEKLDNWVNHLPLVAVTTGVVRDSGDVHSRMRPKYLEEHRLWLEQKTEPPPMVRFMQGAYETAWQGKIALLKGDLATFGSLMNRNHRIVDQMMNYCGFTDGAGWANNLFIQAALDNGALGAKLTGAGSGGSVFALTLPGQEEGLMGVWQETARREGLNRAQVYPVRISHTGLTVKEV